MSRIGKLVIPVPSGVTVKRENNVVTVTGPLGTLSRDINPKIETKINADSVEVINNNTESQYNAFHGLYRQLINNMVVGVSQGFTKSLTINGVGYRVTQKGNDLELNIGFSHPVILKAEEGIKLSCEKNDVIVSGIDKEKVGQYAAKVRSIKPVEPYHAYGIYYSDEVIVRKEVKSGKK
ncbi:MAG: 50S ribosomal protein L6 [Clostridia bacterium]|nr:50S ribosomal protein L6 [Clostridia bacterium]